jgi:hypothetical protein
MTAIVLWILRILVVVFVLRLVVQYLSGRRPVPVGRRTQRPAVRAGGTLVQDPQCGTYIPESKALTIGKGPNTRHFCSATCRDKWMAAHS